MSTESGSSAEAGSLESFRYDDGIVRLFAWATIVWGVVGMVFGAVIALQLVVPALNGGAEHASFGRMRPMHTNAVVFAFIGNAVFAGVYYATQRLCRARLYSDALGRLHFWGWQVIIVASGLSLPLGLTQSRHLAEMEWPIDVAIAVVWIGFFGVNFFGTLVRRRERRVAVSLWFFIATIVAVSVAHVFASLASPVGLMKSDPVYAGVGDAFVSAWYGQSVETYLLVMPFLGMMYYFLPRAVGKPIYSHRLAALHFWAIVVLAGWAGPRLLHLSPAPVWLSTLGVVFGVALWMPLWGGLANGVLTLRGAREAVRESTALRFFAAALVFYGFVALEGTLGSLRPVDAATHFSDAGIGHAHALGLGWNGFMIFGMLYWLAPRLFQTPLANERMARGHFWIALAGAVLYAAAVYAAGLVQSFSWFGFDAAGTLAVPEFVAVVRRVQPLYWARALGGGLYLAGAVMCLLNFVLTWSNRPAVYAEAEERAAALGRADRPTPATTRLHANTNVGHLGDRVLQGSWHGRLTERPIAFAVCVLVAASLGGAVEATLLMAGDDEPEFAMTPFTPLELAGRDIYIAQGCVSCHSQMVRPLFAETERYGAYARAAESAFDRPALWGHRRMGPDLSREGVTGLTAEGHYRHFADPRAVSPGSVMPAYPWLLTEPLDFEGIQGRVDAMGALGVPYGRERTPGTAAKLARIQAGRIADEIEAAGGAAAAETREMKVVALIAYLRRLGTDLYGSQTEGGTR